MPRNAAGVYALPDPPRQPNTVIDSPDENVTRDDIATELTNSLDRNGRGGMLAPFRIADGTLAAPGLAFLNEPGTGLWRPANGDLQVVVQGTAIFDVTANGIQLAAGKQISGVGGTNTFSGNVVIGGTLNMIGDHINFSATNLDKTIGPTTADGADNARMFMSGGGAYGDVARGSWIMATGNESIGSGALFLAAGDVAGGTIGFFTGAAALQMQILRNLDAVNYWAVQGSISGNRVFMGVQGADPNVGMIISTKGAGPLGLCTANGRIALQIVDNPGANYINVIGGNPQPVIQPNASSLVLRGTTNDATEYSALFERADTTVTGWIRNDGNAYFPSGITTNANSRISLDGGNDTYIQQPLDNLIYFITGGNVAVRMESSGANFVRLGGSATEPFIANGGGGTLQVFNPVFPAGQLGGYFQYVSWNPVDLAGNASPANQNGVATTNGTYCTMVQGGGTLTTTFQVAGKWRVRMTFGHSHSSAYTLCRVFAVIGGTASLLTNIPTGGAMISVGEADTSQDGMNTVEMLFNAAVGQTCTIQPNLSVQAGVGTTANHVGRANVCFDYLGV